ncbi:acyltransferase family protein [Epidermidibacterium keratini]|uniref:Acyltransferase family protein n=1 Tax=Epidermidibacterium keratini TaxID=1891644 RepID=A0A7L4YNM4_9ACTN|nr:acyltransferase [Epidermidibacterium keratini]QHC00493.1 acyltransferase family protein [Epidermidibacterium keratini]
MGGKTAVDPSARYEWMDLTRGLAVLLVIVFHASAIPWMLGVEYPPALHWLGAAATPYRMPTLLMLSGVLLVKSLQKGWWRYYSGKLTYVFWPFAVWMVIYWLVNRGGLPIDDLAYWLDGGYLWFLLVIGCAYLIGPIVRLVAPWGVAVAMVFGAMLITEPFAERFLYYGAFFFLGAQLGRDMQWMSLLTRRGRWLAVGIAIGWAVAVASLRIAMTHELIYFALSVIGVFAVLLGVQRIGDNPIARFLRWMGRNSIVFYVAHFPVILVVTYRLMDRGIYDPWVIAGAGFVIAMLLSIALVQVRDVVPFNWLFEAPTPSRSDWALVRAALRTPREPSVESDDRDVRHTPRPALSEAAEVPTDTRAEGSLVPQQKSA